MHPLSLVSHVNADGDIMRAWLAHYLSLGVTRFHLVVHGPPEENATLLSLRDEYPIEIRETYEGVYLTQEKRPRLERVLDTLADQWVLVPDSDEFLELPLESVEATIRWLERAGADALAAPMVQRMRADGSLESPPLIADPFAEFPLCAPDLYRAMGVDASINKFPLIRRRRGRRINAGSHTPPEGARPGPPYLRGVTHHFKWRTAVWDRLRRRAASAHTWRHESIGYLDYLEQHGGRLPTAGAFPYSRKELFRRGLLRRPTALDRVTGALHPLAGVLPPGARRLFRRAYQRLFAGRRS